MIKCTLELCPGGIDDPETNEHLGTIHIINNISKTVSTTGKRGTYDIQLWKKRRRGNSWTTTVKNFPRLSYHPWNLVLRALEQIAEEYGGRI